MQVSNIHVSVWWLLPNEAFAKKAQARLQKKAAALPYPPSNLARLPNITRSPQDTSAEVATPLG